jgi:hypothetical protein
VLLPKKLSLRVILCFTQAKQSFHLCLHRTGGCIVCTALRVNHVHELSRRFLETPLTEDKISIILYTESCMSIYKDKLQDKKQT